MCGNDPFLRARVVDDVTIQRDADGKEQVNWKERPRASSDWILTEHGVSLRQDAGNDEQHGQDDEGDPDAVTE